MISGLPAVSTELGRWAAAFAGLIWWIIYPFVYPLEKHARWEARCAGRVPSDHFDDCFNDALPLDELLFVPAFVILALYFFARFSFIIYAPPSDMRSLKWRLAGSTGGSEAFPVIQITACLGILWSIHRLSELPWLLSQWYITAYWLVWTIWFSAATLAALPWFNFRRDRDEP